MLEMTKRGLNLMGEAYQASFDELREKISKKSGLGFQESIRLADFIQLNSLDKTTALSNINKSNAEILVNFLRKVEALSDACFDKEDMLILDNLMQDINFPDEDLKELIEYASGRTYINGQVVSVRKACAYFEENYVDALKEYLSRGIKVSSELDTIFTKETLSLAERIYDSKSPIEQRICGVSLIAEILTRKGGILNE